MRTAKWVKIGLLGVLFGAVLALTPHRALAEETKGKESKTAISRTSNSEEPGKGGLFQNFNWEEICDDVRSGLEQAGAAAQEKVAMAVNEGKELYGQARQLVGSIAGQFPQYLEEAKAKLSSYASLIESKASELVQTVKTNAPAIIEQLRTRVIQQISMMRENFPAYLQALLQRIRALVSGIIPR